MSVKVHEAYCIDSFQTHLLCGDDFLGDSIRDLWNTIIDAGGVVAVIDQQDGGIVRLTTGALLNNDITLNWGDIRSLLVLNKVTFETRFKLSSIDNILILTELEKDSNARIRFIFDTSVDANWHLMTDNGPATDVDSGITVDTDYHVYRIECFPTGEVHFYIDDVECGNSPITTNIPNDADDYLQPSFFIRTLTTAVKSIDIDYVVVRQEI